MPDVVVPGLHEVQLAGGFGHEIDGRLLLDFQRPHLSQIVTPRLLHAACL